jgi:hypothetical protein
MGSVIVIEDGNILRTGPAPDGTRTIRVTMDDVDTIILDEIGGTGQGPRPSGRASAR